MTVKRRVREVEDVDLEQVPVNDPVSFRIIPTRIGRHSDPEPFTIGLGSHFQSTPDLLALRISRMVKLLLVSKEYVVKVDLVKMTFTISGGRFGGGRIERIEE